MKRRPFNVTDHALVRYLERVKGMDMDALREEIAAQVHAADQVPEGLPEPTGVVVGAFVFKLVGRSVTTVAPHCQKDKATHRGRS